MQNQAHTFLRLKSIPCFTSARIVRFAGISGKKIKFLFPTILEVKHGINFKQHITSASCSGCHPISLGEDLEVFLWFIIIIHDHSEKCYM